jgi:hypothetical protein
MLRLTLAAVRHQMTPKHHATLQYIMIAKTFFRAKIIPTNNHKMLTC